MAPLGFKNPTVAPPDPALPAAWPEPACAREGPREARITDTTKTWMALLRAVSIAIIAIGIPVVINRADTLDRLAKGGEPVEATVDMVREERGKNPGFNAHLVFQLSGKRVSFWQRLPARDYSVVEVGQRFMVTALPTEPNIYRFGSVTAEDVTESQLNGSATVAMLALGFGAGALIMRLLAQRDRRILETWPASVAQTLSVKAKSAGKSGTTYTIRFRTPRPDGRSQEDTYVITRGADISLKAGDFFTFFEDPGLPGPIRPMFTITLSELVKPAPNRP